MAFIWRRIRALLATVAVATAYSRRPTRRIRDDCRSSIGTRPLPRRDATVDSFRSLMLLVSSSAAVPAPSYASNLPQSTGASLSAVGTVETLIPIVRMAAALGAASSQARGMEEADLSSTACDGLLRSIAEIIPADEMSFKRSFDAYSVPVNYKQRFLDSNAFLVYYSRGFDGANRPAIEGEGEDVVNKLQTMQYGARNEAWNSVDELLSELRFGSKGDANSKREDVVGLLEQATTAFDSYLSLAPPSDLKEARSRL
ncbi:hypothetical protein THAOC_33481 [Thalassiosira oceanica]|uniref:Uncharacterized protein n=1 Tax=Thalassiosira oceanica TaxID=159749 RepID=K0RFR7_THAOC|nr:hypothetical protein THAOC_33481 [Thalassiosira oceanica]|eukprot:EJK47781.1 hypothetical protein THAOC_33481 [Thalassiosira oceanica]